MAAKRRKAKVAVGDGQSVTIYKGATTHKAVTEIPGRMKLYDAAKVTHMFKLLYEQGRTDGARDAFASVDNKLLEARASVPHRHPGRPKD